MKPILAWHFCAIDNGKPVLRNGKPAKRVGETERYRGELKMCASGLHASEKIMDALKYAPGPYLRWVACSGKMEQGDDKLVCSVRRIVAEIDATMLLHEFACRCAERALARIKKPDPRSVAAIVAKRAWMRGEITDADLDASWDVALDASLDVAWAAARAAAWAVALDVAWAVAWDVAWAAARDEARDVARAAEREWQEQELTRIVSEAMGLE